MRNSFTGGNTNTRRFLRRTGRRFRGVTGRISKIAKRTIYNMAELKYCWKTATVPTSAAAGYTITNITPAFPQGVSKNQRIGNKLKYKNLSVGISLNARVLSGFAGQKPTAAFVRIVLFQYRTTITALTDLFDQSTVAAVSTIQPNSVRVLNDERVFLTVFHATAPSLQNGSGNPHGINYKFNHKIHNNVNFNSASDTPTDVNDQYGIAVIFQDYDTQTSDANFTSSMSYFCRVSFIDV